MQIAVANGAWRHGSILSVRVGDVRRQAPLQCDTCLDFPLAFDDVDHVQVDVFARVGSTRLELEGTRQLYDLNIDGEGFSDLAIRVRPPSQADAQRNLSSPLSRRRLEDALAAGEQIEQEPASVLVPHGAGGATLEPRLPEGPPPAMPRPCPARPKSVISDSQGSAAQVEIVRHSAEQYLLEHDLRLMMQDIFQQTLKDQPENPLQYMRQLLATRGAGDEVTEAEPVGLADVARMKSADCASDATVLVPAAAADVSATDSAAQLSAVEADAEAEVLRMQQEQELQDQIASQRQELEALRVYSFQLETDASQANQQVAELTQDVASLQARVSEMEAGDAPLDANEVAASAWISERQQLQESYEQEVRSKQAQIESLRQQVVEQQQVLEVCVQKETAGVSDATSWGFEKVKMQSQLDEQRYQLAQAQARVEAAASASWTQDRADLQEYYDQQVKSKQAQIDSLQKRLQHYESGRETPADAAAGIPREPPPGEFDVGTAPTTAGTLNLSSSRPLTAGVGGVTAWTETSSLNASGAGVGGVTAWNEASPLNASGAHALSGENVNTHMLSQLLAASYAPPVPPTVYYENREDMDLECGDDGKPLVKPELLVDISDCKDKSANGVYACVGQCNSRPLYRLLGAEPRYLYFAAIDPAWQGWWIADKMASDDYLEWFSNPSDAGLPVHCRKGELGSRVAEAPLTRDVVQKISHIGSQTEKSTIRKKLMEAFGPKFSKLDGTQRGLMSKTSPVVSVAHALEAQQRAIQLLHSRLAVETQQREAAETQAQTMEEAFQTLQLRIQAHLPGGGGVAQVQSLSQMQLALSTKAHP